MRGASAQVPSVVPSQGTEGASNPPLSLNSFFVAPNVWTKFSIHHPDVSYSEFYRIARNVTRPEMSLPNVSSRNFRRTLRAVKRFLKNAPPDGRQNVV
jgi:hypothetical protein